MKETLHPGLPVTTPPTRRPRLACGAAALLCCLALGTAALAGPVTGTYLYTLANFGGKLPYDWARIYVDQERDETYVIYQNVIRIFGSSGMEVFSFGDDLDLGLIADAAVDDRGDIILLSYKAEQPLVTRCTYRGVPIGQVQIRNVPAGVVFGPNRMIFSNGRLYFAALSTGTLIVTDATGQYREHANLLSGLEGTPKEKTEAEITGLSVDRDGSIFFTVPVVFRAFKRAPDGTTTSFGRPGSTPGRFGVVAGIVADSRGNVIVIDKLKCAVMVFDKDFNFLTEFGMRGLRPENLIVPDDVAIDKRDRIYVTQGRRRGISVFALTVLPD